MNILVFLIGIFFLFFWFVGLFLSYDMARRGKSTGQSTIWGCLAIVFISVLIYFLIKNQLNELLLAYKWYLLAGFAGTICSSYLGAHFGIQSYHQTDVIHRKDGEREYDED